MQSTSSGPALSSSDAPLLSQIPDLDSPQSGRDEQKRSTGRSDGRLISQTLSTRLVFGGGILIVLAALVPLTLNRKSQPGPASNELSGGASASTTTGGGTSFPAAGSMAQSADRSAFPGPGLSLDANSAPPAFLQPQAGANRPMALGDPNDARQAGPGGVAANYQADARSDPAGDYRTARGDRSDYRDYPGAPQGNPLMPSSGSGLSQDTQRSEPGVARFEGTIEKPPVRNDYDRAGSSIH